MLARTLSLKCNPKLGVNLTRWMTTREDVKNEIEPHPQLLNANTSLGIDNKLDPCRIKLGTDED